MRKIPGLVDVNTDQQNRGLQAGLTIDRLMAASLGISPQAIDNTLYDAFGQRQVSTMYMPLNQYHVVMEVEPEFCAEPRRAAPSLRPRRRRRADSASTRSTRYTANTTPLAVNHSGQFPSVTISFNLTAGLRLGDAVDEIERSHGTELGMPATHSRQLSGHRPGLSGFAAQSSRC